MMGLTPEISFDLGNIITGAIAITSLIVSLYKKNHEIRTSSITSQRMEWIKDVIMLCAEFLIEYNKDTPNVVKLQELEIKIKLHGRKKTENPDGDYEKLYAAIENCIKDVIKNDNCDKKEHEDDMLVASQDMLQSVWKRMKQEAGISKNRDKKYEKKLGLQR